MPLSDATPWLNPPNFLAAMEGGARAGLSAREQDFREATTETAADRLRLAYDSLAAQERRASMASLAKLKMGEAANAIRAAHEDALSQHYKTMQDKANQALENQKAHLELLRNPTPKPLPPGTVQLDASGELVSARGAPGSEALKYVEMVKKKKADEAAAELAKGGGSLNPFSGITQEMKDSARARLSKMLPEGWMPKKRIRVKGPGGKTGTVEEGDKLPEGWTTE